MRWRRQKKLECAEKDCSWTPRVQELCSYHAHHHVLALKAEIDRLSPDAHADKHGQPLGHLPTELDN